MSKQRVVNIEPWGMEVKYSIYTHKLTLIFREYKNESDVELIVKVNIDFTWVSYIRELLSRDVLDVAQRAIDDARTF